MRFAQFQMLSGRAGVGNGQHHQTKQGQNEEPASRPPNVAGREELTCVGRIDERLPWQRFAYLDQSQSSVFAIYSATRHNIFRRSTWRVQILLPVWQGEPRPKNYLDDLSNSGPAVRQDSEGWELGPPEDRYIKGGILMYPAGNLCGGVREWASSYSE